MANTANTPASFESAIAELESIVQAMETGSITLEQALEHYQRGTNLLKYCQETLQAAEQRVQQLEGDTLVPQNAPEDRRKPE
ncbi:MAG TPA: exodeoxyribonuclease VII small subunit [Aromatoleum sp.]|jgi:exodeoxyribonuclease VII small subunit|uniref:exodeoxyribonuclease VII small subunit n=1 Tax=Aromatoleum sp. TaxID=2307007 RepID=UPI002B464459|nr:exodeoxyribonuclease VII small subunit [Aromatoleum sp.]HJV24793.1 exodeoxyribonuclease VII small subunit [Aromatoleum sp.]